MYGSKCVSLYGIFSKGYKNFSIKDNFLGLLIIYFQPLKIKDNLSTKDIDGLSQRVQQFFYITVTKMYCNLCVHTAS